MKRFLLFIATALTTVSCVVVDGTVSNPTTDENLFEFCADIFEEKVDQNVVFFYRAYHIARFLEADPELKVSQEYDLIRTGLSTYGGSHVFDYRSYDFREKSFFDFKGECVMDTDYGYSLVIKWKRTGVWAVAVSDGTKLIVEVVGEDADGLVLDVAVDGLMTEESMYSAKYQCDSFRVVLEHEKIGRIDDRSYEGVMEVMFHDASRHLKSCVMTYAPGEPVRYEVVDHAGN